MAPWLSGGRAPESAIFAPSKLAPMVTTGAGSVVGATTVWFMASSRLLALYSCYDAAPLLRSSEQNAPDRLRHRSESRGALNQFGNHSPPSRIRGPNTSTS